MNLLDGLDLAGVVDVHAREALAPAHEHHARGTLIFRPGRFVTPFLVVDGAVRIDHPAADDSTVLLALPGDLLGLEQLQGRPQSTFGRAIVDTIVAPLGPMPDSSWRELLVNRLIVRQEHAAQLGRLRFGPASERIRALLLLLAGRATYGPFKSNAPLPHHDLMSCELPRLSDMAALTDTAPETVSRVISSMRRSGMITREAGRRVRLSSQLVYVAGEMPRGMTRSRVMPADTADHDEADESLA